jgi:type I restriction enzyme S subunit
VTELPKGWVETTLGDVTADSAQRVPVADEQFQYVDIASIDRLTKRITSPQLLWGRDAPSRARKEIRAGDVLVSMTRPNLNAVALVPPEFDWQIASTGFDVLRSMGIEPRWLFYVVRAQSFIDRMSELVQGALYPAVRSKDVRGYVAPLAPLNEQKRIADKLDALLARVNACHERLDRVPAILKRFRQAVLATATSGRLTKEWRDRNMGASPERESTFYSLRKLAELVKEPMRNGKSVRDGDGLRVLRLSALKGGKIDWAETKRGAWGAIDGSRFLIKEGDFLVARGNGSRDLVGRGALVIGTPPAVAFPDTMIRIRPSSAVILPSFLQIIWDTQQVRDQIEFAARTTAGIWKIAQTDLEDIEIPVPLVDEQHEIVRCVKALFAYADRLEARYTTARAQVERLTPALLAKAFSGELVPQDPNDEPASVLLERIRATRAAAGEKPPRKVRTERKPMPITPTTDTLKEIIRGLPTDQFTFDDLRRQVSADYETLKDLVFDLLSETPAILKQVFDMEDKTMRLVRVR